MSQTPSVRMDASQPTCRNVHDGGYPDWVTPPATPEEQAWMDRHRVEVPLHEPTRKMGPPNYRQRAASPALHVSGMTDAEAAHWFATGELP